MKSSAVSALLHLLLASACLSSPSGSEGDGGASDATPVDAACLDSDDDGYLPAGCGGVEADCTEGNPAIHPGALEIPDNEVDDDCIGGDVTAEFALSGNRYQVAGDEVSIANGYVDAVLDASTGVFERLASVQLTTGNLLFDGASGERLIGSHLWPNDLQHQPTSLEPAELARGPALYRARMAWSTARLSGVTHYTVHPDGRLHIDHDLVVGDDDAFITAFTALRPELFERVAWSDDGGTEYSLASFDPAQRESFFLFNPPSGTRPTGWLCAYHRGTALNVGWAWSVAGATNGPRATIERDPAASTNDRLALQYDFRVPSSGTPAVTGYAGNFVVTAGIGSPVAPCGSVAEASAQLATPAPLEPLFPATAVVSETGDEDADGYNEGGGFYRIDAGDDRELRFLLGSAQRVPISSMFVIDGLDTEHLPVVYRDEFRLSNGLDYLVQQADGQTILFFHGPLLPSQVITVRAP